MTHTIRYAIVGGGAGIAATHLAALKKLEHAQVVGLADPNPQPAQQRAAELGCACYTDYRIMLAEVKPAAPRHCRGRVCSRRARPHRKADGDSGGRCRPDD
jgi:hypothetical protein